MRIFVAVIGHRHAGKSTLIKSLTGCPTNSYRDFVDDEDTGRSVYVVCDSPQERPLGLANLTDLRKLLRRVESRDSCQGIIFAIQPSQPNVRLSMEAILTEVQRRGFRIHAYVLDPGRGNTAGQLTSVTRRLAPLRIVPTGLDGRRFAYLNAERINAATSIVV